VAIWYIFWSFGLFFPVWVFCTKKNLASLVETEIWLEGRFRIIKTRGERERERERERGNRWR
jgi:hypothetical protein